MEIPKPTEDDKEYFRSLIAEAAGRADGVEVKPMFGNLGAFVNGNMFAGLFGSAVGVKLPDAERAQVGALPGSGPFGPAERPMGGYVSLPPPWRAAEPDQARAWVGRALDHVSSLPPKVPKPAKPRTAKKAAK